jgi:hypothetical protein
MMTAAAYRAVCLGILVLAHRMENRGLGQRYGGRRRHGRRLAARRGRLDRGERHDHFALRYGFFRYVRRCGSIGTLSTLAAIRTAATAAPTATAAFAAFAVRHGLDGIGGRHGLEPRLLFDIGLRNLRAARGAWSLHRLAGFVASSLAAAAAFALAFLPRRARFAFGAVAARLATLGLATFAATLAARTLAARTLATLFALAPTAIAGSTLRFARSALFERGSG